MVTLRFEEIESELAWLRELRQKPAGTVRITATEFAIDAILLPKRAPVMPDNPDIRIEFIVEYGLSNIVADRYAGHAVGGGRATRLLKRGPGPKNPQDLVSHNCINLRLPTHGSLYAWGFEKGNRELKARVEGQLTCSGTAQQLNGRLQGSGSPTCRKE